VRAIGCLLLIGCPSVDDPTATDDETPNDTDVVVPPVQTEIVEYDSQGTACLSGPVTEAFGADEEIRITVFFGCIDACDLLSTETRCSATLIENTLSVQSHGHAVYEVRDPDTAATQTTPCTASCLQLAASCSYPDGLPEGDWIFSYSAVVVPFTVPNPLAVCATDTDDT
jgi:hypothetical protein